MGAALISGGIGAMGSLFGGADPATLLGYAPRPGDYLDPRLLMEQLHRDQSQIGVIQAERAAEPTTLPGAFVQPLPWYGGGGLPMPIGVTAQDPALFWPGTHQQREGAKFATPDYERFMGKDPDVEVYQGTDYRGINLSDTGKPISGKSMAPETVKRWMFGEYAPRRDLNIGTRQSQGGVENLALHETWDALSQEHQPRELQVGAGVPQLQANLELMGVTTNPYSGAFELENPRPQSPVANQQLFMGARSSAAAGGKNPQGGIWPEKVPNLPGTSPFAGTENV